MLKWQKFPFVRFVLAFVTGILVCLKLDLVSNFFNLIFVSLIAIYAIFWFIQKRKFKTELKTLLGFIGVFILFFFGISLTIFKTEKNNKNHLVHFQNKTLAFKGVVSEPLQEKDKSFKTVVQLEEVYLDSVWKKQEGKVLVYFQKSEKANRLNYGDVVLSKSILNPIKPPLNPDAFDFKRYLAQHNIHHKTYVRQNDFERIGHSIPNYLKYYAYQSRIGLEHQLEKFFQNPREKGIALALVLGVKDELENEIREVYSEVGAMHILAVSGLHVGLVYQIFAWIFGLFKADKSKTGNIVQTIVLIILIWVYAFVTGLSPSVMRAATMFSFIIVGKATKRNSNIYNTLAVSAFLLLLINPYLITEVGFQLSYLAVIGIVYLQPKIYEWFDVKYLWLDKIWMITSVSIAAQIATSPISIYYFHQFPNYFFISNLIAIPAATGMLGLGLLKLLFSWFVFASEWISWLLEKLIWLTNESMLLINNLPFSNTKQLQIDYIQMLFLYGSVVFVLIFIEKKKLAYLQIATICMLVFSSVHVLHWIENSNAKELVIYNVNNKTAIGFREGHSVGFVYSDSLYQNEKQMKFNIYNHWQKATINGVQQSDLHQVDFIPNSLYYENRVFVWNNKSVLVLENSWSFKDVREIPKFDILLLKDNVRISEELKNKLKFNLLVVDASCSPWYIDLNKNYFQSNPTHIISEKGALVLHI